MTTIDKSKPVMITGATGYVAGWIVKKLRLRVGLAQYHAYRVPLSSTVAAKWRVTGRFSAMLALSSRSIRSIAAAKDRSMRVNR